MNTPKKPTATNEQLLALVRLEPPQTKEALLELCADTTRLTLERDATQVKLDRRLLDLQEAHGRGIEAMNAEIERNVKLMHLWAIEHREAEFEGRQGIVVAGCTLEFRKGTGKVVAAEDEKTSATQLLALPKTFEEEQKTLLRFKCELNKQAVLAMAKTEAGAAFLKKIGLEVSIEEEFKFTPARADLTPLAVSGGKAPVKEATAA